MTLYVVCNWWCSGGIRSNATAAGVLSLVPRHVRRVPPPRVLLDEAVQLVHDHHEGRALERVSVPALCHQLAEPHGPGLVEFGPLALERDSRHEVLFGEPLEGRLVLRHLPHQHPETVHIHFFSVGQAEGHLGRHVAQTTGTARHVVRIVDVLARTDTGHQAKVKQL